MVNVRLPQSAVALVPGTGVRLSIGNANLSLRGNWRVKYLRVMWVETKKSSSDCEFKFILWYSCCSCASFFPTEKTVAHLIWMWMDSRSARALPSTAMRQVVPQSVLSTAQPTLAVWASNSTGEPGKISPAVKITVHLNPSEELWVSACRMWCAVHFPHVCACHFFQLVVQSLQKIH